MSDDELDAQDLHDERMARRDELFALRSQVQALEKERLTLLQGGGVMVDVLERWIASGECFCTADGVAARGPCEFCLTNSILGEPDGVAVRYLAEFQKQLGSARDDRDALKEQVQALTQQLAAKDAALRWGADWLHSRQLYWSSEKLAAAISPAPLDSTAATATGSSAVQPAL